MSLRGTKCRSNPFLRLLRSFHSLAMTKKEGYRTASYRERVSLPAGEAGLRGSRAQYLLRKGCCMQKKQNKFFLLFVYLLSSFFCLSFLSACATTFPGKFSDPTQVPALEPAALLKLGDIPVPSGFIFVPDESYAFQSTNFRAGLLKYRGKAQGEQIVVFFKEQMPMYNWNLVNIVEYGRRMLSFEKEQEACVITIDGKDNRYDITVSIAPRSQAAPRKTDKPIK